MAHVPLGISPAGELLLHRLASTIEITSGLGKARCSLVELFARFLNEHKNWLKTVTRGPESSQFLAATPHCRLPGAQRRRCDSDRSFLQEHLVYVLVQLGDRTEPCAFLVRQWSRCASGRRWCGRGRCTGTGTGAGAGAWCGSRLGRVAAAPGGKQGQHHRDKRSNW